MEPLPAVPVVSIREAVWPADEAIAHALLRDYAAHLAAGPHGSAGIRLESQELGTYAVTWSPPRAIVFLGFLGASPVGCIGVRVLPGDGSATVCELKRLWVNEQARGHGLGLHLVHTAIEWSRSLGAGAVLLDTVPAAMPAAVQLYLSLGFRRTERYNDNSVPDLMFMKLTL